MENQHQKKMEHVVIISRYFLHSTFTRILLAFVSWTQLVGYKMFEEVFWCWSVISSSPAWQHHEQVCCEFVQNVYFFIIVLLHLTTENCVGVVQNHVLLFLSLSYILMNWDFLLSNTLFNDLY